MNNLLSNMRKTDVHLAEDAVAIALQNPNNDPVLAKCDSNGQLRTISAAVVDLTAVTLSLDTSIYASGDVLAATQEVAGAVRFAGGQGILDSIVVADDDDQKIEMDLVFFKTNVALGTENSTPNISDGNAHEILGIVNVPAAGYVDLGGVSVTTLKGVNLPIEAAAGSTSIYMAAITRGTPTHTATGVTLRLGFR